MTINTSTELFKALGDKTRFKIVGLLSEKHYCVGALAYRLNISQAAVSQHLQVLRKAGVVWGEKRGYWTHYVVNSEVLERAGVELQGLASQAASQPLPCSHYPGSTQRCGEGGEIEMCRNDCKHPERLKVRPQDCTHEQIRECHGDEGKHSCVEGDHHCTEEES